MEPVSFGVTQRYQTERHTCAKWSDASNDCRVMPISPENLARYPKNWREISDAIREERCNYRQLIWPVGHNYGETEMEKIIGSTIGFVLGIALVLGLIWLFHWGYLFIIPYFFPDGPARFIRPDYWPFVGVWIGIIIVSRLLFVGIRR